MREVLSIHVGQAGVQLGNSLWELYCSEHGLNPDGTAKGDPNLLKTEGFASFFTETKAGNYVPMAFFVDLEPSVIDEVRTGPYRQLYSPNQLVSGMEDAANNFSRGYFTVGGNMIEHVQDKLQRIADACDTLQGMMVFHSVGGGTGSGFASLLLDVLASEYPRKTKHEVAIYPAPEVLSSVVEPYNSILTTHSFMSDIDCSFILDNEALYQICCRKLDIDYPKFRNINRVVAQAISSITCCNRFRGPTDTDFTQFQTNLVPLPRVHYPVISMSPIVGGKEINYDSFSVMDITKECLEPTNLMIKCNIEKGRYLSCCVLYRGVVPPNDVKNAVKYIRNNKLIDFVDWSPSGLKIGINEQRPTQIFDDGIEVQTTRSCCMLSNTTSISKLWARLNKKFNMMFSKRAFIHWFILDGLEEEDIKIAQENIATLEWDYIEIEKA